MDPIQTDLLELMNFMATYLDRSINGEAKGSDRKFGFMLAIFPFGDEGRFNYISNGASREDMICLFKEMIARFEGRPYVSGNA